MRILFIRPKQPKATHGLKNIMSCEPLELEYIAAGMPNHDLFIFDMLVDNNNLNEVVNSFKPNIIATSCYINNVREALEICRKVKKINSKIITVVGGVHATLNPHDFKYDYIDFIVLGEGITTFKTLISAIEKGNNPETVNNIGFRVNGNFMYSLKKQSLEGIEHFPFPDRRLTQKYRDKYYYLNWRPLAIMKTAWGCPYKCTFCYNRKLTDDKYFIRSAESIVNELETIESKHIFIVDDNFLFNRDRLEKIYKLIKQRNIQKEYVVYGRTDFIVRNEDILQKWAEIGLCIVRVGMEAVTDEELKIYNKKNSVKNNVKAIQVCKKIGIDIAASFLVQPYYRKEDFKQIKEFIRNNGLVYVFIDPLTPLPGTELYTKHEKDLLVPYQSAFALWDFQHCVLRPTAMSLKAFYREIGLIYLVAYNPFRVKRLKMRRKPQVSPFSFEAFRMYKSLIKMLLEIFWAHRDHKRIDRISEKNRVQL